MKIAYICADIGIPVFGLKGASVHVREVISAFQKKGHQVVVYSSNLEGLPEYKDSFSAVEIKPDSSFENISKELHKLDNFLGINSHIEYDLRLLHYNISFFEKLKPILTKENFNFIYERYSLFNYSGIALSKEINIPHILEINSPLVEEHKRIVGLEITDIAYELEHKIFKESDRLMVISKYLQKYCKKRGIPKDRIILLPNGVDIKKFKASKNNRKTIRKELNLKKKIVIGFIGSFRPWHDLETLIESFQIIYNKNPRSHLLVVGNGTNKNELLKYSKNIGISNNITWTGYVPHHQIPKYISAMDICVAPYKNESNFYFSPMKVFEYMALEKAVIAADIGQLSELISDRQTGLLYAPGNTSQLRDLIQELIKNTELRDKIGKNARKWVMKSRTWDSNAKIILESVNQILKKQPHSTNNLL